MAELGLKKDDLAAIIEVFKNNPSISGAAVFGSRAGGSHKPYSDVDIALYGDLNILELGRVIRDLDDLPLVYKFDVVAHGLVENPALLRHIEEAGVMVYKRDGLGGEDGG